MTTDDPFDPSALDDWLAAITENAKESGLFKGLTDEDFRAAGEAAKAEVLGEMTTKQAQDFLENYSARRFPEMGPGDRPGFSSLHFVHEDHLEDSWSQVVGSGDWIDLTEKVCKALMEAGHPGFAEGLYRVAIARERQQDDDPCLALVGRPWFNVEALTPEERAFIYKAVTLAGRSEGVTWLLKE